MLKFISTGIKQAILSNNFVGFKLFNQQTRNTFILKRRYPCKLKKQNSSYTNFRTKNYIYDLVEYTDLKPTQKLELILTNFVEGLGKPGEIVTVKPSFGYKNLLLPKLAVYNSPENNEKYAGLIIDDNKIIHSSKYSFKTKFCLENFTLLVEMNKDQPWKLEKWHLRTAFRNTGNFHVTEDAIYIPHEITGPNLDNEGKEFFVVITINNLEKARVRCILHHYTSIMANQIPLPKQYWAVVGDPIFPEDYDILNEIRSNQYFFKVYLPSQNQKTTGE